MIDIGMSMEDAAKENAGGKFPAIDEGDYETTIIAVTEGTYPKGRPKLGVQFEIINNPELNNRRVFRDYPLPWNSPSGFTNSGLGMLAELYSAAGLEWEGTTIEPEDLCGALVRLHVDKVARQDSNGNIIYEDDGQTPVYRNEVSKIYK